MIVKRGHIRHTPFRCERCGNAATTVILRTWCPDCNDAPVCDTCDDEHHAEVGHAPPD